MVRQERQQSHRHRFKLIQTRAVSERMKAVTLKVAIYEGDRPVTNVETLTFDSPSSDMNEWQKSVILTKLVKEGANVPVYVLEYLLGMYCASDDEEIIRDGLETVKKVLAECLQAAPS